VIVVRLVDHRLVVALRFKGGPHPFGDAVAELHLVGMDKDCVLVLRRCATGVALGGAVVVAAEHHDVRPIDVAGVYREQTLCHRLRLCKTLCAVLGDEVDLVNVTDFNAHLLPLFIEHMPTEVGAGTLFGSSPDKYVHIPPERA